MFFRAQSRNVPVRLCDDDVFSRVEIEVPRKSRKTRKLFPIRGEGVASLAPSKFWSSDFSLKQVSRPFVPVALMAFRGSLEKKRIQRAQEAEALASSVACSKKRGGLGR